MAISIEAIPKPNHAKARTFSKPGFALTAWPLWTYAVIVLFLTAVCFVLFEWVYLMLYSGLAPLPFRILRLAVASGIAGLSAYLGLRRLKTAEQRCLAATLARYRMEEAVSEAREHLAQKQQAEEELRGTHQLLQAALDALPKHVAILDNQGTIIAVNQAWRRFADENGFTGSNYGVGSKYLDFVNGAADTDAAAAGRGIAEVLEGKMERFHILYPCIAPSGQRWFQLQVSRFLDGGSHKLLVTHEDVTEVKLAQQAQRDIDNRILQSRDEERRKIARELHDSSVQKIFAVNLNLMGLKTILGGGEKRVQDLLAETLMLGRECMQELRTTSYLLRPPLPPGHDFLPALNSYIDGFCKRSGIRVNLVLPSHAGRMPANVENALFRVAQETLSNIHRHSQSATATVLLRKSEEQVILEVRDKGKGMPGSPEAGTYRTTGGGLAGIEERVCELGGSLTIQSASPGTIVTATIPLTGLNAQRDVSA